MQITVRTGVNDEAVWRDCISPPPSFPRAKAAGLRRAAAKSTCRHPRNVGQGRAAATRWRARRGEHNRDRCGASSARRASHVEPTAASALAAAVAAQSTPAVPAARAPSGGPRHFAACRHAVARRPSPPSRRRRWRRARARRAGLRAPPRRPPRRRPPPWRARSARLPGPPRTRTTTSRGPGGSARNRPTRSPSPATRPSRGGCPTRHGCRRSARCVLSSLLPALVRWPCVRPRVRGCARATACVWSAGGVPHAAARGAARGGSSATQTTRGGGGAAAGEGSEMGQGRLRRRRRGRAGRQGRAETGLCARARSRAVGPRRQPPRDGLGGRQRRAG